jgi:hypothetical protein
LADGGRQLPADGEPRLVYFNAQSLSDEDLAWADIAFVSVMFATASKRNAPYIDLF